MRKEGMEEDRTDDCVRIEFGWAPAWSWAADGAVVTCLGTGSNLAKVGVEGSNPFARSNFS